MPIPAGFVAEDTGSIPEGFVPEDDSNIPTTPKKGGFSFKDHPVLAEMFKQSAMPNPEAMAAGPLEAGVLSKIAGVIPAAIKSGFGSDVVGMISPRASHAVNVLKRANNILKALGDAPEEAWEPFKPSGTTSRFGGSIKEPPLRSSSRPGFTAPTEPLTPQIEAPEANVPGPPKPYKASSSTTPTKYGGPIKPEPPLRSSAPGYTPPETPLTPLPEKPGIPGPEQPLKANPNLVQRTSSAGRSSSTGARSGGSKSAPGYKPSGESLTPSTTPNTPVPEKPSSTVKELIENTKKTKGSTPVRQSYVTYEDVTRHANNQGISWEEAAKYFKDSGTSLLSKFSPIPSGWTRLNVK